MKRNIRNLFFILCIFAFGTITTSYGMIQEERPASDLSTTVDIADTKEFDAKITEDIDRLIALLQKASQPTLENKIAASCTAIGLGSTIGFIAGSTARLSYEKRIIASRRIFGRRSIRSETDISDFWSSTTKVGVPVALVTAGLLFLLLKKMIQPKSSSELNAFAQKLADFKAVLSDNEQLSQDDLIKLEKIIALTSTIFEKTNTTPRSTAIKKTFAFLGGGITLGALAAVSHFSLLILMSKAFGDIEDNLSANEHELLFAIPALLAIPTLLTGTGLPDLTPNKFLEEEPINSIKLHDALTKELEELSPNKATMTA